jgi:hypothetical protein
MSLLAASAALALPQATQTPTPDGNKPSVYVGGDNPNRTEKKDKSRMRDVKGAVRDQNENPVEGALVKIREIRTGKTITSRTGKDGSYVFHDLSMDNDYELTATRDDSEPAVRRLSQYDTRKPATINLHLEPKKASGSGGGSAGR